MEIERKFLSKELPFDINNFPFKNLVQGYISTNPTIRIRQSDDEYILTIKGSGSICREEYELSLVESQYDNLLAKLESPLVVKKRYFIPLDNNLTAELDIYEGSLKGLITIEVEFETIEDANEFIPPLWFGEDVSNDRRYKNTSLSKFGIPI